MAEPFDLAELWLRLREGTWRIRQLQADETRLGAIVEDVPPPPRQAYRAVAIFEAVLLGKQAKVVALELGIADSSVATAIQLLLRRMGLRCITRAVPHIVVLALHAARRGLVVRAEKTVLEDGAYLVTAERPSLAPAELTPTEREVFALVLEGKTYTQIAVARGKSMRTVRNQSISALHKLGAERHGEALNMMLCAGGRS